jgi:membrane associated rhomboid family serine protease
MFVPLSQQPQPVQVFLSACLLFELVVLVSMPFGAEDSMRRFMITLGGFWPDLLKGAAPIFAGQPVLMFATSALLHGGVLHLFTNMVGLLWLGPIIVNRLGTSAFWYIAALSALGAGGLFAALSVTGMPSVGASGVLFGFLGTVVTWEVLDRQARRESLKPLVQQGFALLAINVVLTLSSVAAIAWQAHLGGFLAGVLCGTITWRGPYSSRWT